jgi:hypothetical protein
LGLKSQFANIRIRFFSDIATEWLSTNPSSVHEGNKRRIDKWFGWKYNYPTGTPLGITDETEFFDDLYINNLLTAG